MFKIPSFMLKDAIVAKPGFNRWLVPPASIAIHLCIGSAYAWSIYNPALIREIGGIAPAAEDWSLSSVVWIFSVAILFLGLSAAVAGKWLEKVGPRCVGTTAAFCWGGGYIIGSIGIMTHQLWLLYLGYGVIGGCGLGLGYVSPVSTLIRWYPDRRGLATGMAIMGFGGGAIIAVPLKSWLLGLYAKAPDYLGSLADVQTTVENGIRYVQVAGAKVEAIVVSASQAEAAFEGAKAGVYVAGTGNTGAASTFLTLGIVYFVVMILASFAYRIPAPGWKPEGWEPPQEDPAKQGLITRNHVHIDTALRTPQFYQLWIVLCFNVTAGIGVISVSKTMIYEIFGNGMPTIVDGAFTATYVLMISVFNAMGRLGWSTLSDYIGRKNTYTVFFVLGSFLYLSIPLIAAEAGASPSVMWLVMFYAATMTIFTMYGGGFATIPAYLADIFGTKFVGGIHGRLLTAWSAAGVAGPFLITFLRERSVNAKIYELAEKVDPTVFLQTFGEGKEKLAELIAAKSISVSRLMEVAPEGTIDPTPSLYNTTMYVMAGLLVAALISNLLMKPVDPKYHMAEDALGEGEAPTTKPAETGKRTSAPMPAE
ncbi:OFA family MFS transporter [Pseudovibrio sp. JE062]|uniref:OFA family MFS transporter n=1 Tax=Pseudovibrio sp. JE062 TaxID=439495 RepID=UPI000186B6B2|nr:OFA family MFS transporter [Pseudovibrio sp. JE062]EEA95854.1 major facilitator superfamily protein [Pseudovibrio sp. JE062]